MAHAIEDYDQGQCSRGKIQGDEQEGSAKAEEDKLGHRVKQARRLYLVHQESKLRLRVRAKEYRIE